MFKNAFWHTGIRALHIGYIFCFEIHVWYIWLYYWWIYVLTLLRRWHHVYYLSPFISLWCSGLKRKESQNAVIRSKTTRLWSKLNLMDVPSDNIIIIRDQYQGATSLHNMSMKRNSQSSICNRVGWLRSYTFILHHYYKFTTNKLCKSRIRGATMRR